MYPRWRVWAAGAGLVYQLSCDLSCDLGIGSIRSLVSHHCFRSNVHFAVLCVVLALCCSLKTKKIIVINGALFSKVRSTVHLPPVSFQFS